MLKITFSNLVKFAKNVAMIVAIILVSLYIITSDVSVRYITRNMARSTKVITQQFKHQGMNKVNVEGKVNLGLLTFKVSATDENS